MHFNFQVLFFIAICLQGTYLKTTDNNERYSQVRYLPVLQKSKSSRPYFFWEANPSTRNPLELVKETVYRNFTNVIPEDEQIKEKRKRKRQRQRSDLDNNTIAWMRAKAKRNRKRRKNKKNSNGGVLEIPSKAKKITIIDGWNIKNDTNLQNIINELNKNPEISYQNLLGKSISVQEVKIPRSKNGTRLLDSRASGIVNKSLMSTPNVNKAHTKTIKSSKKRFHTSIGVFQTIPEKRNNFQLPVNGNQKSWKRKSTNILKRLRKQPIIGALPLSLNLTREFSEEINNGECEGNGGCSHFCNARSTRRCSCMEGFLLGDDQKTCLDINECEIINGGCQYHCYNLPGSFYCTCPNGYKLSKDLKNCDDINECLIGDGHGPCEDTCINTVGSYICGCSRLNGTVLAKDRHSCIANDCQSGKSGCSNECTYKDGTILCSCPNGMELETDGKTCKDQHNQLGNTSCPALVPPKNGYIHCVEEQINDLKVLYGIQSFSNSGTYCVLVCFNGYRNVGDFYLTCNDEGKWIGEQGAKCSRILSPNYDPRYNYIEVTWVHSKPRIKCPIPITFHLEENQEIAYITYDPPKTNIDWKYVESTPSWGKDLEAHLPPGNHWITFKVTDPYTKLTAKCILYITVKKLDIE